MNLDDLMAEIRQDNRERYAEDRAEVRAVADRVMNDDLSDKEYTALQARRAERERLRRLGFHVD